MGRDTVEGCPSKGDSDGPLRLLILLRLLRDCVLRHRVAIISFDYMPTTRRPKSYKSGRTKESEEFI